MEVVVKVIEEVTVVGGGEWWYAIHTTTQHNNRVAFKFVQNQKGQTLWRSKTSHQTSVRLDQTKGLGSFEPMSDSVRGLTVMEKV